MNTEPTIKEDIYQQQSKIIETLRETIKQQAERLKYLEDLSKEYRIFRGAFRSGQTTYSQAMQQVLTAQTNQMQQIASQKRAQSESERLIAQDDQKKANRELVLKKFPDLQVAFDKDIAHVKQITEERTKRIENFFSLDQDGLTNLIREKHDVFESPCQFIITNEDFKQNGREYTNYHCDLCYGERFVTLETAERHCHDEDPDTHKQRSLREIASLESTETSKLRNKFESDLQQQAQSIKQAKFTRQIADDRKLAKDRRNEMDDTILLNRISNQKVTITLRT